MASAFGAGYTPAAQDIRTQVAAFARQEIQLDQAVKSFAGWLRLKNVVPEGATITELEQIFFDDYMARRPSDAGNAANAHADYLQCLAWLQATIRNLEFATTEAGANGVGTITVTDNTAGAAPVQAAVPAGAKAYVTSDPTLLAILDGVGSDTSPIINAVAPPQF